MARLRYTLVLVLLTACSPHLEETTHTFQVIEEDGIPVALTTGGPKYQGELFTYEKEIVLDTGQREETLLHRPIQFLTDDSGNLYINDFGKGSILMFDATGRYLRSIGQKGRGPGEFEGGRIQQIHRGIIQIFDLGQRRTTRFNTDGTLLDITTLPIEIGVLGAAGFVVLPNETRLVLVGDSNMADLGETQRRGAIIISSAGDTLDVIRTPWIRVSKKTEIPLQGTVTIAPMPLGYGPFPMALYHPTHGIVLSLSASPELEIYDFYGHLTRTIRMELDSEPVTEADRESARQVILQNSAMASEVMRQVIEAQAERMPFAEKKAFWGKAEIDDDGYFWLDMSLSPHLLVGSTHEFRVLSPEGEYLGITSRPHGIGAVVSHGQFLILEEDSDSGEILPTVYTIHPAVEGLKYP